MKFWHVIAVIAVVALTGLGALWLGLGSTASSEPAATPGTGLPNLCPDDGDTTVTITVENGLNESGTQTRDQTAYLYVGGSYVASVTDTTAGSTTLDCNQETTLRLLSSNADGEGARISGVDSTMDVVVSPDGQSITFTPSGSSEQLTIYSKAISGVQMKAKDKVNDGYMYDSSDSSATDYETTGATFKSTTNNATATAVGTGGEFNVLMNIKAVGAYTDIFDFGGYVLVDAPVATYDELTAFLIFDGQSLTAVDLEGKESTAYNSYEYVYKVPSADLSVGNSKAVDVEFGISALAGVNPGASDDITIAFAPIGSVREVTSNTMRYSSVSDAASPAAVYTLQSFAFDIS